MICLEIAELINRHQLRMTSNVALHLLTCDTCRNQWLVYSLLKAAHVEGSLSANGNSLVVQIQH